MIYNFPRPKDDVYRTVVYVYFLYFLQSIFDPLKNEAFLVTCYHNIKIYEVT